MKTSFVWGALLALAGMAVVFPARAQIAISPQILDIPAEESAKTHAFRLYNMTSAAKHVQVTLSNWDLDEANKVHDLPPSETSLDHWTIVNPLDFNLEPGKSQAIRLAIRPAVELAPGEHRVMVYFDEVPDPNAQTEGMRIRFRIGAAVYVHVGPVTRTGSLNEVSADETHFGLNVTTSGNATTRFDGQYVVYDAAHFPGKGKVPVVEKLGTPEMKIPNGAVRAGRIPPTAVLPGTTRTVVGDYEGKALPPGRYIVAFTGSFGDMPIDSSRDIEVAAKKH